MFLCKNMRDIYICFSLIIKNYGFYACHFSTKNECIGRKLCI